MSHAHAHGDGAHTTAGGAHAANRRRLAVVLALAAAYMVAEVIGGLATNSLALLADAGHMLSDVGALGFSLFALWMAERPATTQRTFGYHRTEILAALANGATLVAISLYIFVEAFRRFGEPPEVQGALMMGIAAGGLAVNLAGLRILNAGRAENLNVHGAWLHVLTDALGSVGAIVAGGLIWGFGWEWADPLASVIIAILVLYSSWGLLKQAVGVLMESAPGHIDVDEVRRTLLEVEGATDVHDLHVWTITSGIDSLSAHVAVEDGRPRRELLRHMRELLHDRFGIEHITIQLEPEDFAERPAPV